MGLCILSRCPWINRSPTSTMSSPHPPRHRSRQARCLSSPWMMMLVLYLCITTLVCGPVQHVRATDSCPALYMDCDWACPSLPDRCPGNRNLADPCGCCTVCMRQAGQMCSTLKRPCDADFGLGCVNGRCKGQMNLQVRSSTATSINLSWNANLPTIEGVSRGHYVIYYTSSYSSDVQEWSGQFDAGNETSTSIRNLTDGTDYYFRVSYILPGRDGIRLEGPLSEVALHRTGTPAPLGGCEHKGQHYDEGKTIHQSCDSVCDCLLGSWICRSRGCPPVPDVRIINPVNCREEPHPDDPECCTMVKCDEGFNDPLNPADCQDDGVTRPHGETYFRGCEEVCFCDNGVPNCTARCPDPGDMIPDMQTCPHPTLDEPPEGECCPQWACPPPLNSCELNGNTYEDGEYFDVSCSMRCQCLSGSVRCVPRCPLSVPLTNVDCPNPKRVQLPGDCCLQWECEQPPAPGCVYRGSSGDIPMADGAWMDEGCDNRCLCDRGTLMCMPMCAEPSRPSPTPLCPRPVVVKLNETDCCRVIACHDPKTASPNVVQNVSMLAFNTTAITVGFTPPLNQELVERTNGYLIYYTDQSETGDEQDWRILRKDFPRGMKIRGHIMMELNGLLQETTYYIKIRVSIPDDMDSQLKWHNTLPYTEIFLITTSENEPQPCTYKGGVYQHGDHFNDGCDSACECRAGRTICRELCPRTEVLPSDRCPNPRQVIIEGACCPQWRCFPNDGDCSHSNKIYQDGMEWREGCDLRCRCDQGTVSCLNVCNSTVAAPRQECSFPVQVRVADTCCLEWVCYDTPPSTKFPTKPLPLPLSFFLINISAANVSARSATIQWPALTDLQRQYIGQFRLKYRQLTYGVKPWNSTVSFRPELREYNILDLRPARSYVVQLVVFVGSTQPLVGIHLQTSKIEVDTLWLPSIPYPGEPFKIEIYEVTSTTASIRWPALPNEIVSNIIGWRLMVVSKDESEVVESEIVEPSALSYRIQNLTAGHTYHVQLLGLWDNETVTREVRSGTVPITTHTGYAMENNRGLATPIAAIIGTIVALCVFLVVVIAFVYLRIKKRHSERYDVYGRNSTINFRPSNYEHVYEGTHESDDGPPERRFSDAGLLESGRRDSEAELLDID